MNYEEILYEVDDAVLTITLNRPDKLNAFTRTMLAELLDALDRADADDDIRAIVFTGAGRAFCAGADLKASQPGVTQATARHSFVEILDGIMESPKPVLGKIAGHCTGGGVGLAASFDISIAADDVIIGFTEVRLGVAPAVISVVCLPKMRRSDASELFLTGRRFTPSHAADVGLINRAAPADELDAVVDGWVGELVRGGPTALGAAKDLITRIPEMDDDKAFDWTAVRSQELFDGPEAQAGIAAFRDRTDAPWVPETFRS